MSGRPIRVRRPRTTLSSTNSSFNSTMGADENKRIASSSGLMKPGFAATSSKAVPRKSPVKRTTVGKSPRARVRTTTRTSQAPLHDATNIYSENRYSEGVDPADIDVIQFSNASGAESTIVFPSVEVEANNIFFENLSPEFGDDFSKLLKQRPSGSKWEVKTQNTQLKDLLKVHRRAIQDLVGRRNTLIETARNIDNHAQQSLRAFKSRSDELAKQERELTNEKATLEQKIVDLEDQVELISKQKTEKEAELQSMHRAMTHTENVLSTTKQELSTSETSLSTAEGRILELQSQVAALETQCSALESERDSATDQLAELQNHVSNKLREEKANCEEKINTIKQEHATKLEQIEAEFSQLNKTLTETKQNLVDSEAQLASANDNVRELDVQVSKLTNERDSALEGKLALQNNVTDLRQQLQQKESSMASTIESLTKMNDSACARETRLSEEAVQLRSRLDTLQKERDELKSSETLLRGDLRECESTLKQVQNSLEKTKNELLEASKTLAASQEEVSRLARDLEQRSNELDEVRDNAARIKDEQDEKLAEARSRYDKAEHRVSELEKAEAAWSERKQELTQARDQAQDLAKHLSDKAGSLEAELKALKESMGATKEAQMERLCEVTREADTLRRRVSTMEELQARLDDAVARADRLEEDLFEGEMSRRKLHNLVQDLRGNIRVCVRVRPFLPQDLEQIKYDEGAESLEDLQPSTECHIDGKSLTLSHIPVRGTKERIGDTETQSAKFSFDTVFAQQTTQQDVFDEVSELVQSALDGFQVCLFSYGQTGSGKTHTMQGGVGESAGLIPRSVQQILKTARRLERQGWQYNLEASFLEIYNETLRDLLESNNSSNSSLSIIHHPDGTTEVPGLVRVPVDNAQVIEQLLVKAAKNRSVASTSMNEVSSRSHSVFTLHLHGEHPIKKVAVSGTLNLCDLAGSERLDRSKAEGQRLRETQNINKSLSCLADVFTSLCKKNQHIPFRNSKLTYLLQPCFKGNGKTMMFVNISPTIESAHETLCSLRFANQVSQVHLGQAKKRISASNSNHTIPSITNGENDKIQSNNSTSGQDKLNESSSTGITASPRITEKKKGLARGPSTALASNSRKCATLGGTRSGSNLTTPQMNRKTGNAMSSTKKASTLGGTRVSSSSKIKGNRLAFTSNTTNSASGVRRPRTAGGGTTLASSRTRTSSISSDSKRRRM